jgi:ABC-type glutathione transport system ATPase component
MDAAFNVAALRQELSSNLSQGVTQLAELASRHANNRQLVYRAVLLKRELSRADTDDSPGYVDQGLALLDDFIADQASVDTAVRSRHDIAEEARRRAMAVEVSLPVAVECEGLSKGFGRGESAKDVSLSVSCGEIVGIVGLNGNGKTTLFRLLVGELRQSAACPLPRSVRQRPHQLVEGPQSHRLRAAGAAAVERVAQEQPHRGRRTGSGALTTAGGRLHRRADGAHQRAAQALA